MATSSTEFRRFFQSKIADPMDVVTALDALEDIAHEASGEVEANWQSRSAGAPWRALGKILGSARVRASNTLKRRFGFY
jgi:hypothetical protein